MVQVRHFNLMPLSLSAPERTVTEEECIQAFLLQLLQQWRRRIEEHRSLPPLPSPSMLSVPPSKLLSPMSLCLKQLPLPLPSGSESQSEAESKQLVPFFSSVSKGNILALNYSHQTLIMELFIDLIWLLITGLSNGCCPCQDGPTGQLPLIIWIYITCITAGNSNPLSHLKRNSLKIQRYWFQLQNIRRETSLLL